MNIEELENLGEALIEVDEMYGILGVFGAILLAILFLSLVIYHKSYLEKSAKSIFEQSLAKYKSELIEIIGSNFISKTGEIQKELTELKQKLDLLTDQETNWLNEKRASLIKMYQVQIDLAGSLMGMSAISISDTNLDFNHVLDAKIEQLYHNWNLASGNFKIYCQDPKLFEIYGSVTMKNAKLRTVKSKSFTQCNAEQQWIHYYKNLLEAEMKKGGDNIDKYSEEISKRRKNVLLIMSDSSDESLKIYKEIINDQNSIAHRTTELIKETFKKK